MCVWTTNEKWWCLCLLYVFVTVCVCVCVYVRNEKRSRQLQAKMCVHWRHTNFKSEHSVLVSSHQSHRSSKATQEKKSKKKAKKVRNERSRNYSFSKVYSINFPLSIRQKIRKFRFKNIKTKKISSKKNLSEFDFFFSVIIFAIKRFSDSNPKHP